MSWVLPCKAWELQVWSMSSPGTHIPTWRVQKPEHTSLPHTVRDNWGEGKAKNERKSAALELPVLWGLQKVGVNVSGVKSAQRFTTSVARAQPCGVLLHDLCNILTMSKHAFFCSTIKCFQAPEQVQCRNTHYCPAEGDCEPAQCSRDGHGLKGK